MNAAGRAGAVIVLSGVFLLRVRGAVTETETATETVMSEVVEAGRGERARLSTTPDRDISVCCEFGKDATNCVLMTVHSVHSHAEHKRVRLLTAFSSL